MYAIRSYYDTWKINILNTIKSLRKVKIYILLFIISISGTVMAQDKTKPEPPTSRILFVFDASQSMYGTWESDKKITIARKSYNFV